MKDKIPDKRVFEKMSFDLSRLFQGQNFESEEQLKNYMDNLVKEKKILENPPKSTVGLAQDIIYDAWERESRKERIKMAKDALSISLDCADAYNLLAEEDAKTYEEAKELYQKGIDAGRRALGEKFFKENKGHFWGYVPTRPYMRSLAGLMECLWELGEHEEAIVRAKEMIRLNVSDNQGIRYIFIAYLAELGRYDELDKFLNKGPYKNDCGVEWLYTDALLVFIKEGNSEHAVKALNVALKSNSYVPAYITGKKPIPRILPDMIRSGSEEEGFCCASRFLKAWKRVSGAIKWLEEQIDIMAYPKVRKVGRNELCPCGSGKKHKKCCGA